MQLKDSVYAIEDPTVPGPYIRLDGDRPELKPPPNRRRTDRQLPVLRVWLFLIAVVLLETLR